jgi:hypothetical protein
MLIGVGKLAKFNTANNENRKGGMRLCTLLGKVLLNQACIASTSDNPYSARTYLNVVTPSKGYRYIATVLEDSSANVPWNGMLTRGLNAQGLAFTYSFVPGDSTTVLNRQYPGNHKEFTTELLTSCKTVEEAIAFLQKGIPTGATGNYLLCDEKGTMAVAEISNGDFELEMKPQIIRTNVFLLQHEIESTNKSPEQYEYAYGGHVSFARLERGQDLLTEAQTIQEILGVLSDHNPDDDPNLEYGLSICNHGTGSGTISSELSIPSLRTFIYRYGNPCGKSKIDSWDSYYAFCLQEIEDGQLTDLNGRLTVLGQRFAKKHFALNVDSF